MTTLMLWIEIFIQQKDSITFYNKTTLNDSSETSLGTPLLS